MRKQGSSSRQRRPIAKLRRHGSSRSCSNSRQPFSASEKQRKLSAKLRKQGKQAVTKAARGKKFKKKCKGKSMNNKNLKVLGKNLKNTMSSAEARTVKSDTQGAKLMRFARFVQYPELSIAIQVCCTLGTCMPDNMQCI